MDPFAVLCTMPGMVALKMRAAASWLAEAIGMVVATNTSAAGAAAVMWSIRHPGWPSWS
jgi:hypothetical protein